MSDLIEPYCGEAPDELEGNDCTDAYANMQASLADPAYGEVPNEEDTTEERNRRITNVSNARAHALRYSDDQPRDADGKFGSGGGSSDAEAGGGAVPAITASEVEGHDSREVTPEEFQALAAQGKDQLDAIQADKRPDAGDVTINTDAAYAAVQESWGGATIDPTTGEAKDFPSGFAVTIREPGQEQISTPEKATADEFAKAVDTAKTQYADQLQGKDTYFGVFHDDDKQTIDIDPVAVVSTKNEAETIGAYTHAVGGAYDFSTGNGVFPPHIA
jgi:hypothetical protein